jgi:hypothetical protein
MIELFLMLLLYFHLGSCILSPEFALDVYPAGSQCYPQGMEIMVPLNEESDYVIFLAWKEG